MDGKLELLKYLIEEKKFDPSSLNASNESLLHVASLFGHLPVVKYLTLEKNCDPLFQDKGNSTPFILAVGNGRLSVVQFFISVIKNTSHIENSNALDLAAYKGNLPMVRLLIEGGCNPSHLDARLWTPLHYATSNGQLSIVEYLTNVCS